MATMRVPVVGFSRFNGYSLNPESFRSSQIGWIRKPIYLQKHGSSSSAQHRFKVKEVVACSSEREELKGPNMEASGSKSGSIVVAGVSFKSAPVEIREKLATPKAGLVEAVGELIKLEHIQEAVVLSTCNRVEVYFFTLKYHQGIKQAMEWMVKTGGIPLPQLQQHVYVHIDKEATRHLFHVSSGLDSLILGEHQILAQVKQVHNTCQSLNPFPTTIASLFKHAILTGKRVRSQTKISAGVISVSSVAVQLALQKFPKTQLQSINFLVIGCGKMGKLIVTHLAGKGCRNITVVNRTENPVTAIRQELKKVNLIYKPITGAHTAASDSDVIFTCTSSETALFVKSGVEEFPRVTGKVRVFVDIAVPRNVDESVKGVEGVKVFDIDDLKGLVERNKESRKKESVEAKEIVEEEVRRFWGWKESCQTGHTIKKLGVYGEKIRVLEMEKCLKKIGRELTGREKKVIEELSCGIVRKILSRPMKKLRFGGGEDGEDVRGVLDDTRVLEGMFGLEREIDG